MSKYVNADQFIAEIERAKAKEIELKHDALANRRNTVAGIHNACAGFCDQIIRAIKKIKTEDVAPVVHAHWIFGEYNGQAIATCSNCQGEVDLIGFQYCPTCGAKMDEEVRNE